MKLEGWRTVSTATTGDQGADIVADNGMTRVAVQCKYYSKPVGNAAVQEVIAARAFYEASVAIVVSRFGFTRAAKSLADKALVQLLLDTDLQQWARSNRQIKGNTLTKVADIIMVLNGACYRVARKSAGDYDISTPKGLKHVSGDSALSIVAEELLKANARRAYNLLQPTGQKRPAAE